MNRGSLRRLFALVLVVSAVSLTTYLRADDAQEKWDAPARAARKKNPIPAAEASIAAGKVVYVKNCLACHGPLGKGDGPKSVDLNPKPHDLTAPAVTEQSDGALFWKITEGKKPMPTFEKLLSEQERWQVINYVRTLAPAGAAKP
jgi:mono/diheme cytochrome c family protein